MNSITQRSLIMLAKRKKDPAEASGLIALWASGASASWGTNDAGVVTLRRCANDSSAALFQTSIALSESQGTRFQCCALPKFSTSAVSP
jgi:hypothetical protein